MTDTHTVATTPNGETLAQRANKALLMLAARGDQQKSADELAGITAACKRAEDASKDLDALAEIVTEFATRNVPYTPPPLPPDARKATTNLRGVATRALDSEEDLTSRLRGNAVQTALETAEAIVKRSKQALIAAADTERRRVTPDGIGRPITVLPGKESVRIQAQRIQSTLQQRAAQQVTDLPAAIDGWRAAASEWNAVSRSLAQAISELPPEIKAFIEAAVSDDGAGWSLLTPAVREWLDMDGHGDGYVMRKW
ncbi:hypothetical protein OG792_02315 [Micromonospora sp. NBC_01699]|uniref:hypothetical protein n=1 Tax=Micromonospora sp. NBC_01699 TaxID=2975984 RepID=UPI002E27FB9C|nr:hypothetical protein [Micromonospora sp. NBC_01699]